MYNDYDARVKLNNDLKNHPKQESSGKTLQSIIKNIKIKLKKRISLDLSPPLKGNYGSLLGSPIRSKLDSIYFHSGSPKSPSKAIFSVFKFF